VKRTLTIGIPTYNGGKYIGIAIESVLNQLKKSPALESKIEVLISDNASQDDVWSTIEKYVRLKPDIIHYFRNDRNIGFDRNVDLVVRKAEGEFAWILSDDDFIADGAVERVLRLIEDINDEDVSVIFVNYENSVQLKNNKDILCSNGNIFLQKTQFKSGLISSNIVSRSSWLNSRVERFFDSGWIHFGYVLVSLAPGTGHKGYVLYNELIIKGGEGRWGQGGTFINTGFELVKIFRLMPQLGYNKKISKRAVRVIKDGYPVLIPLAKAKGLKTDFKLLRLFIELYGIYPSFWLIDIPLLLLPQKIYESVYFIFRKIKR
jgi:abequosyltransferase